MLSFLKTTPAKVLTTFLILQAIAFYGLARTEPVRSVSRLATFPQELGEWKMVQEGTVDAETMEVLKADDVVTRWYGNPSYRDIASLFIAYFGTQRSGKTPHSPKNCLPGAGWLPIVNDRIYVDIPGSPAKLEANRYIVARGDDKSLVIYWYHTRFRTIADEYQAKFYTVLDSIRHNRSDTAVVKVTIPIRGERTEEQATEMARDFIRTIYPQLGPFFPL